MLTRIVLVLLAIALTIFLAPYAIAAILIILVEINT